MSIPFAKGHGTENDFVLLDDPEGRLDLTPAFIRQVCERRAGLGADGVIRVIRTERLPAQRGATGPDAGRPEWFMDYWNADGSPAEMCGNGLRVFVTHLLRRGWIDLAPGTVAQIGTRGGVKAVHLDGGEICADLGPWQLPGGPEALVGGGEVKVSVPGLPVLPGVSVRLGNPHVVVMLPDVETLAALDLTLAPVLEPAPAGGTNVEFAVPLHEPGTAAGHLRMRVYERGVGETRSCGTGVVAAALAARAWASVVQLETDAARPDSVPDRWRVDVPGGTLRVRVEGSATSGATAELAGPAVIVAEGELLG